MSRPIIYTRCIQCKKSFTSNNVFSSDGWKETQISGMCEKCFDELFREEEEDTENYKECCSCGTPNQVVNTICDECGMIL